MSQDDERERIRRIRDAQIRSRDPIRREQKQVQRRSAQLRAGNPYTWEHLKKDIKSSWVWMLGGAIFGALLGLLVAYTLPYWWAQYAVLFLIAFGAVSGRIIGMLIDRGREEGWRH